MGGHAHTHNLELDGRREVGILISNASVVRKMQAVFEDDWKRAGGKPLAVPEALKTEDKAEKQKDEEKQKAAS